jgi:hypothetical protein
MISGIRHLLSCRAILLATVIVGSPAFASDDIPATFSDYQSYYVGDSFDSGTVYLAPGLIDTLVTIKSDQQDTYSNVQLTIQQKTIRIGFDPGPSEDPMFIIHVNGGEQYEISGHALYVSASGTLYARTDSDDYFSRARKFNIVMNTVEEVEQPYYLVDRHCKTSTVATLYARQCNGGERVAALPSGTDVHILVAEYHETPCDKTRVSNKDGSDRSMSFLVATPFGLTGWVTTTPGYLETPGKPLDCITYNGD